MTIAVATTAEEVAAVAAAVSPDPFPDQIATDRSRAWVYAPNQYELGTLHRLVAEGRAANVHVDYVENYGPVAPELVARRRLSGAPGTLVITSNGVTSVEVDGRSVIITETAVPLTVTVPAAATTVSVRINATPGPATFTVEPTAVLAETSAWEVVASDGTVFAAAVRLGSDAHPPHTVGEPGYQFAVAADRSGLVDLGAAMLARVMITAATRPVLRSGESAPEARSVGDDAETRHDLARDTGGRWASVHRLGLRYLRVEGDHDQPITVEASVRSVRHRGAFACSDDTLNRIWATSAYTLRSCMQTLMVDGIKRDRMPWIGDQALSTLGNAYAFADGEIVRDSMTALGFPQRGYINGISDYSLWWVINQFLYQRYYGDVAHLRSQADHIDRFVGDLAGYATAEGIWRPPVDPHGFLPSPGSAFLDWGVSIDAGKDLTALQMLWFWALRCAAALLERIAHPGADRWSALAERLEQTLRAAAWDPVAESWREYLDEPSDPHTSYPNFLAVLSGIGPGGDDGGITEAIERGRVGTPFMTAFALQALAVRGRRRASIDRIRTAWGSMLAAGAGTFWEEFADADNPYAMYGRTFGKSLCHAWSAGPAMLLPQIVLGLRPLADGWSRFEIDPDLGDLRWAGAVVPVPTGRICVIAQADGSTVVDVPDQTVLVSRSGESYAGPQRVF